MFDHANLKNYLADFNDIYSMSLTWSNLSDHNMIVVISISASYYLFFFFIANLRIFYWTRPNYTIINYTIYKIYKFL